MNEMQQIITVKNTIAQIQQLDLTDLKTLRETSSDLFDSLWIALYDYANLALKAKSHTNRKGERKPGNIVLLASVNLTPDDVSAELLVHLYSKLDKIVVKPVDDVVRYMNTIVYRFCLDQVRRRRPDPASLDMPVGPDGSITLGELIADERSDFLGQMVEEDRHQEEFEASREVVLRLMGLMQTKPGVASALLSRLMGLPPRAMVADMRKNGAVHTVDQYVSSVCKTVDIPVPTAPEMACSINDLEQQMLLMMKKKVNGGIVVLSQLTGISKQEIAESIRVDGVESTVNQCGLIIRGKLANGSRKEQALLRTMLRHVMLSLSLHTYDDDAACAIHISKLVNRHRGLLAPRKIA